MDNEKTSKGVALVADITGETSTSKKAETSELLKGEILRLENLKTELENLQTRFEKAVRSGKQDEILNVNSMLLKKRADVSKQENRIGPKTIQEIAEQENLLAMQKVKFASLADKVMLSLKEDCLGALIKHKDKYQDLFFLYRTKPDNTTKSKKVDAEVIASFKEIDGTVSETQQVRAYMQVVIRLEDKVKK